MSSSESEEGYISVENSPAPTPAPAPDSRPDPLLLKKKWGSTLFVGLSGTGKTTIILTALKSHLKNKMFSRERVFCLNTKGGEYDCVGGQTVEMEEALSLPRKSMIIVEDIISLEPKKEVILRKILNYNLHHREQRLFAATHSNVRTKLWSSVHYFDYIVFPAEAANSISFRSILTYFQLEKGTVQKFCKSFVSECQKGVGERHDKKYVFLDVKKMELYVGNSLGEMVTATFTCIGSLQDPKPKDAPQLPPLKKKQKASNQENSNRKQKNQRQSNKERDFKNSWTDTNTKKKPAPSTAFWKKAE